MPYCYHPLIHEKILKGKIPKDEIHNFINYLKFDLILFQNKWFSSRKTSTKE